MESSKKYKIWIACTLACTLLAMAVPAAAIVYTDPFFFFFFIFDTPVRHP